MIIKDKIQIGSYIFDILFENNPLSGTAIVNGHTSISSKKIIISSELDEKDQFRVFLHELEHLTFDFCGLSSSDMKINAHNEGYIEAKTFYWQQIIEQIVEWQVSK